MVKINRIYTRTGDDGTTGLVDGSRISKFSPRIAAIGAVDSANSALGFAAVALMDSELAASEPGVSEYVGAITRIQNDLFDLGADIATPGDDFTPTEMVLRIVPAQVGWLEQAIDAANAELAPLTSFVLPGGSEASARLHLARAQARLAEQAVAKLADCEPVNPSVLAYINRLSDYLFVLARVFNDKGASDVLWIPGANR